MGPLGRFQTLTERYGVHKKRNPGAAPKRSVSTATGQSTQNRRPALKELENRDEALKIVRSILDVESTPFHLVSYGEYAKAHGSFRSDVYKGYHFLCYANSTTCAKWLVCSFALNQGGCELSKAVRAFKPNSGTTSLNEHTKTHKRQPNAHFSNFVNVSQAAKKRVAVAAGVACALGHLPMSFTDRKQGMVEFAQALLDVGKTVPLQKKIKASEVLPCATSVTTAIAETAQKVRDDFRKKDLQAVLEQGGGVTSDGLTDKLTGRKLYDLVLHYFHFSHPHPITGEVEPTMKSRVMFVMEHKGCESAAELQSAFTNWLIDLHRVSLDELLSTFTFVTDCAATMPCIAGASSSSQKVPFCELWVGCISHQLNTAMKKAIDLEEKAKTQLSVDLKNVKILVRAFKQSKLNMELEDGCKLVQEVDTRFATTFSVVDRFLKSCEKVSAVVGSCTVDAAKKALAEISVDRLSTGEGRYPTFQALKTAFAPIAHIQKDLEAGRKPTMHNVLPELEKAKVGLQRKADGKRNFRTMELPTAETMRFCKVVLGVLDELEIHPLWLAACLLHPGYRFFRFISDTETRQKLLEKGENLVKTMMSKVVNRETAASDVEEVPIVQGELGVESFNEGAEMDFSTASGSGDAASEDDELMRYKAHEISPSARKELLEEFGIAKFWYNHSGKYPVLSKVALRVHATPPSSASSERDFSDVHNILRPDRSCTSSTTLFDLIQIRTHYSNQ